MRSFVGPGGKSGIIVGARLRTRRADADVPFGVTFADADDLAGAVPEIMEAGTPLWHLAFLNPEMARARGLAQTYLLLGAYPRERSAEVEEGLRGVAGSHSERILPAAAAYRAWGERFFPMVPSHPIPNAVREFVSVAQLREARSPRTRRDPGHGRPVQRGSAPEVRPGRGGLGSVGVTSYPEPRKG